MNHKSSSSITKKMVAFHTPKGVTKGIMVFKNHKRKGIIENYIPSDAYLLHVQHITAAELKLKERGGVPSRINLWDIKERSEKLLCALMNPYLDDFWYHIEHIQRQQRRREADMQRRAENINWKTAKFN